MNKIQSFYVRNDYYGDLWASFNLQAIQNWITGYNKNDTGTQFNPQPFLLDGERFLPVTYRSFIENVHQHYFYE